MEDSNNLVFIDVEKAASTPMITQDAAGAIRDSESAGVFKVKGSSKDQYHCKECKFKSSSADRVQQHKLKKHRSKNKHNCSMCPYSTYSNFLFQEHVNRHKGIKPFKCSLCDFSSVSKKYIKQHEEKHVACVCGLVFRSSNSQEYKQHLGKCGKSIKCKMCAKEYNKGAMERHRKTQEMCIICSELTCIGSRKKHMTTHGIVEPKTKRVPFHCALCDWSSSITQKVLLHLIHHPDQKVTQDWVDLTVLKKCGIIKQ